LFGEDISAYLPEQIKPFAQQLRQFPLGYPKWLYAASAPDSTYQGDIYSLVPFACIDHSGSSVRADCLGMVISATCDNQPDQGEFVLVAPVINLNEYRQRSELQGDSLEDHIRALTENKISQLMFLPRTHNLDDSFADFGNISSVSLEYFHSQHDQARLASLSQYGHYFMLMKLAYHICRPELSDVKRT
jgi:hypothetical protein